MDRFPAEQEDRHNGKQGGNRCINGTGQGGFDTVIDHIRHCLAAAVNLQVLADTVENNDGTVDGIAYNRQQGSYKGGINFQLQQGEPAQGNRYVDDQGYNGCQGKVQLEPDGNINDHQHPGKEDGDSRLLDQFASDGGAYVFHTADIKLTQRFFHILHNCRTVIIRNDRGTDQHALGRRSGRIVTFQLDDSSPQIVFAQHFTDLGYLHGLFELQIHDAAAGKINAQVKAPEDHGTVTDH